MKILGKFIGITDLLSIGAAVVLICTWLLSNSTKLKALFGPQNDFKPEKWEQWTVPVVVLIALACIGFTQWTLDNVEKRNKNHQETHTITQKKLEEAREAEKQAERDRKAKEEAEARTAKVIAAVKVGNKRLEERVENLTNSGATAVSSKEVRPGLRITQGSIAMDARFLGSETIQVTADDKFGEEKGELYIHIFDQNTFWKQNSSREFEDKNGVTYAFVAKLEDLLAQENSKEYEIIIGIGLESNSPVKHPQKSAERAAVLCGLLYNGSRSGGGNDVFGIDLGDYRGSGLDTEKNPQRHQRPVVIVGVNPKGLELREFDLIEEIILEVEYSGLDLTKYSKMRGAQQPDWITIEQCKRN